MTLGDIEFTESEILAKLREVSADGEHSVPTRFDDPREERLYWELAEMGLIRWCPYPEEFYLLTPKGTDLLKKEAGQ
jgi:hypothetical protein